MSAARLERDGPVRYLVLDRPERLNAITLDMGEELIGLLDEVARDPGARALVMTGSGDAFSAGGDFDEMERVRRDPDAGHRGMLAVNEAVRALYEHPLPTVARINGDAFGGGASLALACDLRVAEESARLGFVFHRVALSGADAGASWLLPRLVGYPRAMELLMLGRTVEAREAERLGLVTQVVAAPALEQTALALASKLAAGPPVALRETKRALREGLGRSFADDAPIEADVQLGCFLSDDFREGLDALKARRTPEFRGR